MSRYSTLFQVEILHDYFLNRNSIVHEALGDADRNILASRYSLAGFLEIAPDEPTAARLAGHKMLFRTTSSGFLVAAMADSASSPGRPAIPPASGFALRFSLRVKDPRFFNYTELGPADAGFSLYSNASSNEAAGMRFLTRPTPGFDPSRRYVSGATYAQAAGPTFNLFRAVRDTGPSAAPTAADWERLPQDTWDPGRAYTRDAVVLNENRIYRAVAASPGADLGDANDWLLVGTLANQYASFADAVTLAAGLFTLDLDGLALPSATVRLFRSGQATAAGEWSFMAEQGNLGQVQLDLRGLPTGLYRLEVLDGDLVAIPAGSTEVYLAPAAQTGGWFGAIEIGLGSGSFALLAADGTLRSPTYTLRFLNRATRWRYLFPAAQPVGPGAEVAVEAGDARTLVTAVPRPLTRFGTGVRLQADDPATSAVSEEIFLPEPETTRIRRQNAQWYSEIHLSNLPLGL